MLVGFEPEDENGSIFLRLRKGATTNGVKVIAIASHATRGLTKMSGELVRTVPGEEPAALAALDLPAGVDHPGRRAARRGRRRVQRRRWPPPRRPGPGWRGCRVAPGTAVRSRPAACPTCCPADVRSTTPRRAPTWPPPGASRRSRPTEVATRQRSSPPPPPATLKALRRRWRRDRRPARSRRRPRRHWPPPTSSSASRCAHSDVTAVADVVLPIAPVVEKPGTFVNWEGRVRTFDAVLARAHLADRRPRAGRHRRGDGHAAGLPHASRPPAGP